MITTFFVVAVFLYYRLAHVNSDACSCLDPLNGNVTNNKTESDIQRCFESLSSCSEVELSNGKFSLREYIDIYNTSNISLLGSEETTVIVCSENAGLSFTRITNLTIKNVSFRNCTHLYRTENNITCRAAVLIMHSTHLNMENVEIRDSDGTGLALIDVSEVVKISHSTFASNKVRSTAQASGGGGLYIEIALSSLSGQKCKTMNYSISHCNFTDNKATSMNKSMHCDDGTFAGIGSGGGMGIWLGIHECPVHIAITDSLLARNTARWGGGLDLKLCNALNNEIRITDSNVTANRANTGGGGIDVLMVGTGTTIAFQGLNFEFNSAQYGGGLLISNRHTNNPNNTNSITSRGCTWRKNFAHYASAIDIFPAGVIDGWATGPMITLKDSTFESNYYNTLRVEKSSNIYTRGEGVIMITALVLIFKGETRFVNNSGSCIYAISSNLEFSPDAYVLFLNNTAENGAGIALIGYAVISVHDNTTLTFCNNNVSQKGAAIFYYSVDRHAYVHKGRCFIQKSVDTDVSNAKFNFFGNTAPKRPVYVNSSDYRASSVFSSVGLANCSFNCVGNFSFADNCNESMLDQLHLHSNKHSCSIKTSETNFSFSNKTEFISFIPGRRTDIPLSNFRGTTFDVAIENLNASIVKTYPSYSQIHSNTMILTGKPGDTALLTLTERGDRKRFFLFKAKIEECPPLYRLTKYHKCKCYTNNHTYYVGFFRCEKYPNVTLRKGFWVGYIKGSMNATKTTLHISYCPNKYCKTDLQDGENDDWHDDFFLLPMNRTKLDTEVCADGRRGTLCGECRENRTVYFYSRSFKCGKTDLCHLGPLFYLLSEILPLTILFLLVIFFNISFTSGDLNGFIFYTQMYVNIIDVGGGFLIRNEIFGKVQFFHKIIYRFFNLDFFGIDILSFCLWRNASTLSILMFKYVTVVYAFVLVLGTVWGIQVCSRCKFARVGKMRYSVIQGISAFLVMAYSQCTEISISILNPITIYKGKEYSFSAVFFQGNIKYFSPEHLPYAIPALLCILTFVTLIPLVLITYPLCNRVLAYLGLAENRVINKLQKPITKIKPLLDCFQGTFKDDLRFFAGLYFVYRATILASRFASSIIIIYAIMELQFIIMLILHTILWPYQKRIHNIIDTLFIANLAIITILKLLTYNLAETSKTKNGIAITRAVELLFGALPLIVIFIYTIYQTVRRVKSCCRRKVSARPESVVTDILLLEDDIREQSLNKSTDSYILMRERQLDVFSK